MAKVDTPANCTHYHRPVTTFADRVALAMAEGDTVGEWPSGNPRITSPSSEEMAAELGGVKASYVRSTMRRIRDKLGPQAR